MCILSNMYSQSDLVILDLMGLCKKNHNTGVLAMDFLHFAPNNWIIIYNMSLNKLRFNHDYWPYLICYNDQWMVIFVGF